MQALVACGVLVKTRTGKGSHVVLCHGQKTYPVSLHNGDRTELSDVYIRGICRKFGIDYQTFRSKL
jgi:hypothetical protein